MRSHACLRSWKPRRNLIDESHGELQLHRIPQFLTADLESRQNLQGWLPSVWLAGLCQPGTPLITGHNLSSSALWPAF
jgi:hypothetical protein